MIVEIQEELRSIFLKQNNITESIIFLEELEENEFNTSPWISILPNPATLEEAWHWDNAYTTEDKFVKVQRKYNIVQAMAIRMQFEDKNELNNVIHYFLQDLPKEFVINNSVVSITPQEIEYLFAKGVLGVNNAIMTVNTLYPIYNIIESTEKIKQISFDIQNKLREV